MGYLIGIGGSALLAALCAFFLVYKSNNEESDSDVDYHG
jgi:glucose-6-phosphate isomerase